MIILNIVSNRLADFLHLFNDLFQPSGMVSSVFSSRLEDFLHFHSEYFSGLLEWFLLFFNLLMKNEKEILIKCIYLITLMFFRIFQILLKVSLVFGFLLLNVFSVFKQFTNFNECDMQWGFALTVYLS